MADMKAALSQQTDEIKKFVGNQLKDIKKELQEIKSSQEFLAAKYEELVEELDRNNKKTKALEDRNSVLEASNIAQEERIINLEKSLDNLEQYGRRDCVEITNIPWSDQENPSTIVKKIATNMGLQMTDGDISTAHRLPKPRSGAAPTIIVKFTRRDMRTAFYAKRKLAGTAADLGYSAHSKIFINESLTRERRKIFHEVLKFKKENGYRFIWTHFGKIFIKKSESSERLVINAVDDLRSL
ncbi:PREDICTED: uncharacterized protein LOC106811234 [Priapulus caudatus]|uniref:Uncharacterized protein LOC106811234 n=1 Tax=Priapulus caudatus TaxID=37621 RepID=A0ABM1EDK2_PRICU|nr:PREDICTED: uncharacterized protein LOC106811234 [Priapulus caudatus]